jgi:hypothetical protein
MKSESIPTLVGAVMPLMLSVAILMTSIRAEVGTIKVSHSYTLPVGADCDSALDCAQRSSRSSVFISLRTMTNFLLRTSPGKGCNASIISVHLCVLILTPASYVRQVGYYTGSSGTYVLRLYVIIPS